MIACIMVYQWPVLYTSNIFPMSKEASNTFIHIVGIATFGLMIP